VPRSRRTQYEYAHPEPAEPLRARGTADDSCPGPRCSRSRGRWPPRRRAPGRQHRLPGNRLPLGPQPGGRHAVSVDAEPVPRMHARLPLLLCTPLPVAPGARRGRRLLVGGARQDQFRGGAGARAVPTLAGRRDGRPRHRHRPLSAHRRPSPAHAEDPLDPDSPLDAGRTDHERNAGRPRHRPAGGALPPGTVHGDVQPADGGHRCMAVSRAGHRAPAAETPRRAPAAGRRRRRRCADGADRARHQLAPGQDRADAEGDRGQRRAMSVRSCCIWRETPAGTFSSSCLTSTRNSSPATTDSTPASTRPLPTPPASGPSWVCCRRNTVCGESSRRLPGRGLPAQRSLTGPVRTRAAWASSRRARPGPPRASPPLRTGASPFRRHSSASRRFWNTPSSVLSRKYAPQYAPPCR